MSPPHLHEAETHMSPPHLHEAETHISPPHLHVPELVIFSFFTIFILINNFLISYEYYPLPIFKSHGNKQ